MVVVNDVFIVVNDGFFNELSVSVGTVRLIDVGIAQRLDGGTRFTDVVRQIFAAQMGSVGVNDVLVAIGGLVLFVEKIFNFGHFRGFFAGGCIVVEHFY